MNTSNSPQSPPVQVTPDETSAILPCVSATSLLSPRSALVDARAKSRPAGIDSESNISSSTIKRSQAISNIQDLDEDSPVTFVIEPNEHNYPRKNVRLQLNPISINQRTNHEPISSSQKQSIRSVTTADDESDTRSESSEKISEYVEEDRPILPGVHVKGATLNRLIRMLIDTFGK
jgi:hypothetical protein